MNLSRVHLTIFHCKKYACRDCEEYVAIAVKPPQPIERGLPGPGLLAHTLLSKYGAARQRHAVPILNALESWLQSECDQVLPQSPIGKSFTYTRNQWPALRRYTDDGALSIDNNLAERMMKLSAIGRKNWLFVGSEAGGRRAAILLSVIASAKHCGVEPRAWLTAVLRELPLRRANARGQPPAPGLDRSVAGQLAAIAPGTPLANRRTASSRKNPLPPSKAQPEKTVIAVLVLNQA